MSRKEFMDKVIQIYFRENCSISNAIEKATTELGISKSEFINMFGKKI